MPASNKFMRNNIKTLFVLILLLPLAAGSQTITGGGKFDAYNTQGNGTKVQLSTGSTTTNDCVKFDASGNAVDSGGACGGSGTPGGSNGQIQYNNSGAFGGLATSGSGSTVPLTAGPTFTGDTKFTATTGTVVTATDGSTVTFDLSAGNIQQVTLGGSRTLALSNAADGKTFTLYLIQDGSGNHTVTWFSNAKWPGGTAPTLTTTAGAIDAVTCMRRSSSFYACTTAGLDIK
jgi:hypothetical protein